jgi:hypothetical protein
MQWQAIETSALLGDQMLERAKILAEALSDPEVLVAVRALWREYPTLAMHLTQSLAAEQESSSRGHVTAELSRLLYWTAILGSVPTVRAKMSLTTRSQRPTWRTPEPRQKVNKPLT